MSGILSLLFMMLIVALVGTVSIDGQSTVGSGEANDLTFADEMQSQILNEIRSYLQSQVQVCCDNCSQIEHLLGRHLNNITDTLHGVNNRLGSIDKNVRNGREFSEDLQLQLRNLSKLYEKQENNFESVGILLKEHDQHSRNQSVVSNTCDRQVTPSVVTWPRDCADIRKVGQNVSDVYEVSVVGPGSTPVEISVYCDMDSSDERSWLVLQRRKDGSENFERTWIEYRNGFGNSGEFWLGNNALHLLTSNRNYNLRIEMEDFEGDHRYAEYEQFVVGPASDNYRLNISGYSGNAGDSMETHNGHMFSTVDADHDNNTIYSCAQSYHGAWWYSNCHSSNLNGLYLRGNHTSYADGVEWGWFRGHHYSLMLTEMKIAPRN